MNDLRVYMGIVPARENEQVVGWTPSALMTGNMVHKRGSLQCATNVCSWPISLKKSLC